MQYFNSFKRHYRVMTRNMCHWSFYPWLVWSLGATFFFAEYFAHVSLSVMLPQLMRSFHIAALSLGAMSAFFWWSYVFMQVPVGALVDRYGPHLLLMLSSFLCAMGCIIFSVSTVLWLSDMSRLLIGFGASFSFVSTLKLAKVWFPPSRFGFLVGLTQALGMLGAVVGQGPVAFLVSAVGWRKAMGLMGLFILLLSALIGIFVRDHPDEDLAKQHKIVSAYWIWKGLLCVLKNPQAWINGLLVGCLFAPTGAFGELWGVNYLMKAYHLSQQLAGMAVSLIFIGWAVGGPLAGLLSDYLRRRRLILSLSACGSLFFLSIILYVPHLSLPLLLLVLFLYGVANTGVGVSYTLSGEITAQNIAGISMAFANMASVLLVALYQPLIGAILDWRYEHSAHKLVEVGGIPIYSVHDYQMALLVLPICLVLALLCSFAIKETYCLSFSSSTKQSL